MLEIKVDKANVHLKGSGSAKENVTDAIVAVIALVEHLAETEHLTREGTLEALFGATADAMRDFKADAKKSEVVTMPYPDGLFKDKE